MIFRLTPQNLQFQNNLKQLCPVCVVCPFLFCCECVFACLSFFWFCAVSFPRFRTVRMLTWNPPWCSAWLSLWVSSLYCEPGTPFPSNLSHPGRLATTAKTATQVTQVYDDATDWYSEAANPWLSEKQREEVRPIFLEKMGRFWLCLQGWKQHY